MDKKYSEIFKTRTKLYRYNYVTKQLEEVKRVIRKSNQGGVIAAVVLLDVVRKFEVTQDNFEENPLYWIQLCEDVNSSGQGYLSNEG